MADDFDPYYTWLGIPPKDQPPNHYRLLGLEVFESSSEVIENAADRQMAHVRTMGAARYQEVAQRVLNEVAAARVCLLSGGKRAAYDADLRAKIASQAARETPPAGPTPSDKSPGAPVQSAPVVQPLYSHDPPQQQDPSALYASLLGNVPSAASPPSIAPGYYLAPQTPRVILAPSRPRPVLLPLIALGALTGLATVMGLWLLLRSAGSLGDPIAQSADGPSVQSSHDMNTDERADPLTSEQQASNKQSVVKASELPRYALRFSDQSRVELKGTAELLKPLRAYTVEVWVRPRVTEGMQAIVGNLLSGNADPEVGAGKFLGWMLVTRDQPQSTRVSAVVMRGIGGGGNELPPPVLGQWVHLVVTFEERQQVLFANGRRLSTTHAAAPPASKSDLCLGVPPSSAQRDRARFDGEICGLRVSSGVRYQQPFSPAKRFPADADTLVLLDFDQTQAAEIRDLSGKNYHGRIMGATWVPYEGASPDRSQETPNDPRQVDLLKLVDLAQDRVEGKWEREGQGLTCDTTMAARIVLPAIPQGDYELEVEFTRREGDESINLTLPVGERQIQFAIHAYPREGLCAGLDLLDGAYAYQNASTVAGVRLENGRRYRAVAKVVRAPGEKVTIETQLDGKKLFAWTGAESALDVHHFYRMPDKRCFGLASFYSTATFHSARVRMLNGQLTLVRKTTSGQRSDDSVPRRP